jgi:hypothetical protein
MPEFIYDPDGQNYFNRFPENAREYSLRPLYQCAAGRSLTILSTTKALNPLHGNACLYSL